MVQLKSKPGNGQKKKPGDFKRPKRKVGRKVTPTNVTNATVQSRRINMTEQTLLVDKSGAAMTHRNQTLQDILTKVSHYNAHVRRDSFYSLKELVHLHPAILTSNIGVVVEKVLQGMVDDEEIVREACVSGWKEVIASLTASKSESSMAPFVQLIAVYFCSGLTHIKVSVRNDVLQHINAILDVPSFAHLFARSLSPEQSGRLVENFKDMISTKAPPVHVKNSYSLLAEKAKAKQSEMQAAVLKGRCFAVEVVHKLLQALDAIKLSTCRKDEKKELNLKNCPTLLIYPEVRLVGWSEIQEPTQKHTPDATQHWSTKAKAILPSLLSLWMECNSESSSWSPNLLKHMILIVKTVTIIISEAKRLDDSEEQRPFVESFFDDFPMSYPDDFVVDQSSVHLWKSLNLAIAQFGCECLHKKNTLELELRLATFLQSQLSDLVQSTDNRSAPHSSTLLKGRLQVLSALLEIKDHSDILESFTALYVSCPPNSAMFRVCTDFAIHHLEEVLNTKPYTTATFPSWDIVLEWMKQLGSYLLVLYQESHDEMYIKLFRVFIAVLKRLPGEYNNTPIIEAWLESIVVFFNSKSSMWFGRLDESAQVKAVALLYHVPNYPVEFLRNLAMCCKSTNVSVQAKSFLIDIITERGANGKFDRAALLSFYMSTLFADGNDALCPQVCQQLTWLHLGSSLPSILAPILSKQNIREKAYPLVLSYVTCLKSNATVYGMSSVIDTNERRPVPNSLEAHLIPSFSYVLCDTQSESLVELIVEGILYCNGVFIEVIRHLVNDNSSSNHILKLLRQSKLRAAVVLYVSDLIDTFSRVPSQDHQRQLQIELDLITKGHTA
ncbi:unnamed protein product [Aphanomyces euteiches]|uniref:Uncharacterized protein n=1 Tax=Aphanomyces euteiches TaxID=100861 RepID=A0A6G0X585_9STRA|nr:hypothetical protein Ae201684_008487 [Aphanomyces euteiches]KAH9069980.1 hypothetical protein Ae201684P_002353 [Aphanomyces euteiches]